MITKTKVKRTFTEGVAGSWDCCARGALAAEPLREASGDAAWKNPAFHITYVRWPVRDITIYIFFLLKLSRDKFKLSRDNFELSRDN